MNRCFRRNFAFVAFSLAISLGIFSAYAPSSAFAQTMAPRDFPKNAIRGRLTVTAPPDIVIDGTPKRLSPGSKIHGQQNELVMSANLVNQTFTANYVFEPNGLVHEVWLLTADEAKVKLASATPPINLFFPNAVDRTPKDDGKTPFDQLPKYNGSQP